MNDQAGGGGAPGAVTVPEAPRPSEVPPFDADPASVTAFGEDLRAASTQVDDFGGFVPGQAQAPDWIGDAGEAYRSDIRPRGRQADAMSLALRNVAHRVLRHADRLTTLKRDHEDLVTDRTRLDDEVVTFNAGIDGSPADQAPAMLERSRELTGRVTSIDTRISTWQQQLSTEESEMREAFRGAMTLDQVEQRWGGVADPADAALARRPPDGASPGEVNAWWDSLSSEEQQAIMAAAPGAIGNLDGVPASARDEANRVSLSRDLHELEMLQERAEQGDGTMTMTERQLLENARAAQDAIDKAEGRLDPQTLEPIDANLYMYDPGAFGGDGRMALAYGDPDTADHVSVHVPGMTTDMTSAVGNGDDAWAAYAASRSDTTDTVATMAWIGYDAPDNFGPSGMDIFQVAGEGLAEEGGDRLADTMDGLDAIRDDDPHVTVVGHSYGSTTTGHGAASGMSGVDDIVLIGSPGAGADHRADDLGVGEDHVWVGTNSSDPVSYLGDEGAVGGIGTLGHDPADREFGGTRFQAEDTERFDGYNYSIDQHTSYYEQNSESLSNMSQIITGQYDDVQVGEDRYDPWYWEVVDPEQDRDVTNPDTGAWEAE